ncbi:MAG: SDR family NAD(P)-dependent oxidoreductase [Hyphomicrobiales bacterium]
MNEAQPRGVVLITGASGGIGEAFAHAVAADGHGLAIAARSEAELSRVREAIETKYRVPVAAFSLDLVERGACDALAEALAERALVPDILINNAGFGLIGKAARLSRQAQLEMIDLNVRALTDLTLRYLPDMIARRTGGVVNVASIAAFMPGPQMAVYFATKAFVLSFTEALAEEARSTGVTVTSVCPGPVETGFQARAGMKRARALSRINPMSAEEVARAGWAGFKSGKRTVVPGLLNKITAYSTRGAPRRLLLPILRRAVASAKA